jgi:hypothetical protein
VQDWFSTLISPSARSGVVTEPRKAKTTLNEICFCDFLHLPASGVFGIVEYLGSTALRLHGYLQG